jgi:hypothetical protein
MSKDNKTLLVICGAVLLGAGTLIGEAVSVRQEAAWVRAHCKMSAEIVIKNNTEIIKTYYCERTGE